jgi:hypothetical protein
MFPSDGGAIRALTRPLRLAIYKRSSLFEADVTAEINRLKAERPNAPEELVRLKLARDNMPSSRRAVWREAARRLAGSTTGVGTSVAGRSGNAHRSAASSPRPHTETPIFDQNVSDLPGPDDVQALALAGEHRVHLWTPGGPGSLMETLQRLADQGLMTVETDHDDAGDPTLIFHPVALTPSRVSVDA